MNIIRLTTSMFTRSTPSLISRVNRNTTILIHRKRKTFLITHRSSNNHSDAIRPIATQPFANHMIRRNTASPFLIVPHNNRVLQLIIRNVITTRTFRSNTPLISLIKRYLIIPVVLIVSTNKYRRVTCHIRSLKHIHRPPKQSRTKLSNPATITFRPVPMLITSHLFTFTIIHHKRIILIIHTKHINQKRMSLSTFRQQISR